MNITLAAQPMQVKRDADGTWHHPDVPQVFSGFESVFDSWAREQNLSVYSVRERLTGEDFTEWAPEQPEGEGWFTLRVTMGRGIANWTWARKVMP